MYEQYNFVKFKDSALKELYDNTRELFNNINIEYRMFTLDSKNREDFMIVLYNLTLVLFDIKKKAPYYNLSDIEPWLDGTMNTIINYMANHVIDNSKERFIERRLKEYKEESRKDIRRYFDTFERELN